MKVTPETMPGALAETTRQYPRTLRAAFPDSEDSASGIELVATKDRLARFVDRCEWVVACVLLSWLIWMIFHVTLGGGS